MNQQIHNGQLVVGLMEAMLDGERSLNDIPMLVKTIIEEKMWKDFYVDRTKQFVTHETFAHFVAARPLEGLGTNTALLKRICADDKEVLDLIDQAEQGNQGKRTDLVDNVNEVARPTGNARQHALRKLRKDRPDLHAQVLAEKLSPHAAMVKAGYRKKTFSVSSDPVRAAQFLKRRFTREEIETFTREWLKDLLVRD